jgi:hypothetical protein
MNTGHFRKRPLAIALAASLAFGYSHVLAADVEIRTPAGGGFAVRDSTGSLLRMFLDGSSGALTIPFLTTAAAQPNPICFQNGTGLLGLKDRVEALGGRITLNSQDIEGTRLAVEIPSVREARRESPSRLR